MKSKTIGRISTTLIIENFKMFWYIPLLSFICYFFGGIFPLISNMGTADGLQGINYLIWNNFKNLSVAFIPLMVAVPLIAACVMMSFYHRPDKALAFHSQPFSKSRLFNSQALTGWLMCIIPVILTALLFIVFMEPVYMSGLDTNSSLLGLGYPEGSNAANAGDINIYTLENIFGWAFLEIAVITFFYCLFILAGALVGTTVMQVLLSGVFFGIVPVFMWITMCYCDSFLIGYSGMTPWMEQIMMQSNPLLAIISKWGFGYSVAPQSLIYLFCGLVFLLLARLAYDKSKLEMVGDSMIYYSVGELIVYLVVYVGMAAGGFFFYYVFGRESRPMLLLGMVVGTLLTWLVMKIIMERSIKVFSKKNLLSLCIFFVLASIFTAVTVFDVTGYAKRVPDADKVKTVTVSSTAFMANDRYYNWSYPRPEGLDVHNFETDDPQTIAAMLAVHQYVVENDLYNKSNGATAEVHEVGGIITSTHENITFSYTLDNGYTFRRYFNVDDIGEEGLDLIQKVLDTQPYEELMTLGPRLEQMAYDVDSVSLTPWNVKLTPEYRTEQNLTHSYTDYDKDGKPIEMFEYNVAFSDDNKKENLEALIAAMDQDALSQDYRQMRHEHYNGSKAHLEVTAVFDFIDTGSEPDTVGSSTLRAPAAKALYTLYFQVTPSDTNAMQLLADWGYIDPASVNGN